MLTVLGGPGPEIILRVDLFQPGVRVQVLITLTTDSGQSEEATLIFISTG